MPNRLSSSTSPYLLQHADNPVDWWPWGSEAFAEARRRDVPVLLSVGYSACHWCHVMAHESFEDPEVAELMNAVCVPVKVDREERPDVDAVYMAATVAATGQGGWPMTCLLTPDGEPFHAGTYYPREQLVRLLAAARDVWATGRADVGQAAAAMVAAVGARAASGPGEIPSEGAMADAVTRLARSYDARNGGFGGAPKFPPSMVLEWLLRHHERTGSEAALAMAEGTLTGMASGGMHDQLGGGFARYAVDATWTVPHFEKMLYDNALLLRAYTHWWRLTGAPRAEEVARGIVGFLLRDLRVEGGAFAAALDADTEGVEGLTYVWTREQLVAVLGADDGPWAADVLGVTAEGTFEEGASVLRLRDVGAPGRGADRAAGNSAQPQGKRLADRLDGDRLDRVRQALLAARQERPQPARDDKVVASWNGLVIGSLAEASMVFGEATWLAAARAAADHVLGTHVVAGRLRRVSRDDVVGHALGVLDDHGNLAEGLLLLAEASGEEQYLAAAGELLDCVLGHFRDGSGGFFDTADDAESLVTRPRGETDGAEPGGTSAAASALLRYATHTVSSRHRAAALEALGRLGGPALREPRFAGWALAAVESVLAGSPEVVVTAGEGAEALARVAWLHAAPGQVTVAAPGERVATAPGRATAGFHSPMRATAPSGVGGSTHPLLIDRSPDGQGRARAFVCRHRACLAPVSDPDALRAVLRPR